MSPVHPLFKPLLDALSGKSPMTATFHFDTEVRAEFLRDGLQKFAIAHIEVDVEAETEEAACDLAAREILSDLWGRIGSRPSRVEVIRSDITREDAHHG